MFLLAAFALALVPTPEAATVPPQKGFFSRLMTSLIKFNCLFILGIVGVAYIPTGGSSGSKPSASDKS
jgi:hypothetical protein